MTYPHGGAGQIWRDGSPTAHNPEKGEIRDWGLDLEGRVVAVEAAVTGTARYTRDTLADLNAISGPGVGDAAYVLDDPDNTGTYEHDGGAWNRVADLPKSLVDLGVLREELDGKSGIGHSHGIADVTSLQTALDAKAPSASPNFTGTVSGVTKAHVGLGDVDNTPDAGKPVSTAQQTALDAKAPSASPNFTGTVSGVTKAHVGLGDVDNTSDAGKPVSTAQQTALDAKAPSASPNFTGTVSGVTKEHVGLGDADNTSDAGKPVSTAQQTALDAKAPSASPNFTGTVSGVTKAHVGLGDADNTSDAGKPVSTAGQTALDAKAPSASPNFTGTVAGVTKAHVGLGSVDNTSDAGKPVSTAGQTALDAKAPKISPNFTGTVSGVTKAHVGLGSVDNTPDAGKPVSTAGQTALDGLGNRVKPFEDSVEPEYAGDDVFAVVDPDGQVLARLSARRELSVGDLLVDRAVDFGGASAENYAGDDVFAVVDPDGQVIARLSARRELSVGDLLVDRTVDFGGASAGNYAGDDVFAVVDPDGQVLARLSARRELSVGDLLVDRAVDFGNLSLEEYHDDAANGDLVIVDPDGRIVFATGAVATTASVDAVTDRLNASLTPDGYPKEGVYGAWLLRQTRQAIGAIRAGSATDQLRVNWIGDSWIDSRAFWVAAFATQLAAEFGDAATGYVGFAWNSAVTTNANAHKNARANVLVEFVGSWTSNYIGVATPDLGSVVSVTAGDTITIDFLAGNNGATLFFAGSSAGSARYNFDGGAWTVVDVSGDGTPDTAALIGVPATAGTLTLEVVSGEAELAGVHFQGAGPGVVTNKLGVNGTNIGQWITPDAADWQAMTAHLDPTLTVLLFGTNDQVGYTPAQFATNLAVLIDRCRAALPLQDILVVMPCENDLGRATPMSDYAAAAYPVAVAKRACFLDLQYYFGDDISEYNWASPRQWIAADQAHPSVNVGGYVITDALFRLITKL